MQRQTRGRPRKYDRPARAVTVTLPEDILGRLSAVHSDIGSAIVKLVEQTAPARRAAIRPAEVTRFGNRAVILVRPTPILRRLRGVHLVPVGDGRALIALAEPTSIPGLELQVRDALDALAKQSPERAALQMLADILRRSRGPYGPSSEARTIIVLASKQKRRSN